jgi:DNA-directed RNA polymerase specialized sigma24 family protein
MLLRAEEADRLTTVEVEAELRQLCSGADYARAKSLARTRAAGLVGSTAEDLLQEAITKLLSGERRWPRGVHPLVVLATAMHSIASNLRKSTKRGPIDSKVAVDGPAELDDEEQSPTVTRVDTTTPEHIADAKTQLEEIQHLVAGDEEAELVVLAWAEGLRGKEAADELGFDMHTYEAARKRLIRKLTPLAAVRRHS